MIKTNLSLHQEIVVTTAIEVIDRNDEENETVTPAKKTNFDSHVVGNMSNLSTMAMGRKEITRSVLVKSDYEEVSKM